MMRRAKGATLGEIVAATGWQKHTIRGLVSTLGSQGGMKIESAKSASGERTYRILNHQGKSISTAKSKSTERH
jgi:hypothetical protein